MNIFALSECPKDSAQQMIDKHVVKMPTESCQMLHTNSLYFLFWNCHGREPSLKELKKFHKESHYSYMMKPAMLNHPSTIWARQNKANYMWLYNHALALCKEYTYRYGKVHSTNFKLNQLLSEAPQNIKKEGWREPPPAMSHYPQCIVKGDSIQSYKNYYNEAKAYFAKWSKRETPDWFTGKATA